ncbi:MAG: ImmA/IrrE family metallo-endopeptidase [Ardenticatenaceae bacterium]|nr:ImmA/IrrE family metallo-endopeptidase [Ardenticatenaceae bacterium]
MPNPRIVAERVLDELGINSVSDLRKLELIAWARGAVVRETHLSGAEARLVVLGKSAVITLSTTVEHPQRKRFSIAHELGHLEMHRDQNLLTVCLNEDIDNWVTQRSGTNLEQQANQFASALLLPRRLFASLCVDQEPSLDRIAELADLFDVSLTATALRYVDLSEEPVAAVYSQNRYIKWFHSSRCFKDLGVFIELGRLDPTSRAASFFRGRPISTAMRQVKASVWLASGEYQSSAYIQEQSWVMPNYNAVLTLLWIDDDIEEDSDWA